MRIVSLASGSSGNALLVDDGETRLLVDCGIGPRTLRARLAVAGVRPEDVNAVAVTHEHDDHARGLAEGVTRWGWTVIGSEGTIRGLPALVRRRAKRVRHRTRVGDLDLELVPIRHDAREPVGYTITARASGFRAGIAHDLGEPTAALVRAFHGVDLLCIEANHDVEMLRTGPYPRWLKTRIASATGHLSNEQTTAFLDAVATPALRAVLLLHLSVVNNTPEIACAAVRRGIRRAGSRRASLAAAARYAPSDPIGDARGVQLALAI